MSKTDSVRLYKVRKLISELSNKEGRGTELVSLYIPPKKPIHEAIANLREEWGTAGNIKSDTTRNHVQDALTRAMQRLKLYKTPPDTGLVVFSGALPTNGPGSEVVNVWEIVPPKPVTQYLYQCLASGTEILLGDGNTLTMEELKSDWRSQNVMSYDFDRKSLVGSRVRRYVKTSPGSRSSFELVTESGRKIQATEDHPFWTPRGWIRLDKIMNGDMVAVLPTRADLVGEYLRIKSRMREASSKKLARAQEMWARGVPITQISNSLSLEMETARQWAQGRVRVPLFTGSQLPTFEEWVKLAKKDLEDPLVWETVVSKNPVQLTDVRDITVEQQDHSFIANGFLVHNCDDHFHVEWLKDMLRDEKVFGLLVIDSSDVGLGILSGGSLEIADIMTSGISGKTRKGGQSARRYERGREMELTYFFNRVAEHATRTFIDSNKVTGLIVGGPGPTKDEFLKGGYLHYELQKKVIAVLDLGYSGREGVRELVEKAGDILKDVRLVEEKRLVQRFLGEVNRQGGLAIYGLPRVVEALQKASAEIVLVSDDLDMARIDATCKKCGTPKSQTVSAFKKIQERQDMAATPCLKCGATDYDFVERDLVDVLEELAFQGGSKVEIISSGTEEGGMFKTFGGIAAILRYRS